MHGLGRHGVLAYAYFAHGNFEPVWLITRAEIQCFLEGFTYGVFDSAGLFVSDVKDHKQVGCISDRLHLSKQQLCTRALIPACQQ